MNGSNDLTCCTSVSSSVTTWLSTWPKLVRLPLRMVGYNIRYAWSETTNYLGWCDSGLNPITVKWSSHAQSRTDNPAKVCWPDQLAIPNCGSFPREDISIMTQIALPSRMKFLTLKLLVWRYNTDEAFVRNCARRSVGYEDYLDYSSLPLGTPNSSCDTTILMLLRIYRYHPSYRQHGCGRVIFRSTFNLEILTN